MEELNARERASLGGQARAKALTAEQRSESARRAVKARWAKKHAPSVSVSIGVPGGKIETQQVEVVKVYNDEPLISTEVNSWNPTSSSFVITRS